MLRVGTGNAVMHNVPTCICTTCATVVMPDAVADDGTCTNCVAVLSCRRRVGSLFNLVHDV